MSNSSAAVTDPLLGILLRSGTKKYYPLTRITTDFLPSVTKYLHDLMRWAESPGEIAFNADLEWHKEQMETLMSHIDLDAYMEQIETTSTTDGTTPSWAAVQGGAQVYDTLMLMGA
jgi:hypothetical protein